MRVVQDSNIWIGCTRQNMPFIFNALSALNETIITKLWIWDAHTTTIPSDMFAQVRPRVVSIERSRLATIRVGAFAPIAQRLKTLELRNNKLLFLDPLILRDLGQLEVLDVGKNKLTEIAQGQFDSLESLEVLLINGNHLKSIEDRAFQGLKNLKILNLADNKLKKITNETFFGLDNLEVLHLKDNDLTDIDWNGFLHLKKLKVLDLGHNRISSVTLRGLQSLEKLYINNNNIQSLTNVNLFGLKNLSVLYLDRNSISQINDEDLQILRGSGKLSLLTLNSNQIKEIGGRAFQPVESIKILSLSNNDISSIINYKVVFLANASVLLPLKKLVKLDLSRNNITEIGENDLSFLSSLKELLLDDNQIENVSTHVFKFVYLTSLNLVNVRAFTGLHLTRFFLANNKLKHLPKGIFDNIDSNILQAVDVSGNPWQCKCGEEWLPEWLVKMGRRVIDIKNMGCMATSGCDEVFAEDNEKGSVWIAVIASVLAVVSLLILIAIGFLYLDEGKLRRASSDLEWLIPRDTLNLLSQDNVKEPLVAGDFKIKPQFVSEEQIKPASILSQLPSKTVSSATEKKRVRFQ
uniref:LRRCT domain-containing protein n=1 Tax=Syphacia muris TaxID=451379 RepID=A0A0N5AIL8_9BILA